MRYLVQILLIFSAQNISFAEVAKIDPAMAEMTEACIKGAKKFQGTKADLEKVCACSAKRMLEMVRSPNYADKNAKPRLAWLKKMYLDTHSQAEIDKDPYDIFEFGSSVNEGCIKEL